MGKIKKSKKIKIILSTVPQRTSRSKKGGYRDTTLPITPNTAIISLLRWIEKFGYSGEFYDIDMLLPPTKEIFNYFKSKKPDVVGISAVVSTSYPQVKRISKIIREACPPAWIILGGNMAAAANVLLRKTEVDICVLGDGEKPLVRFLNYMRKYGTKKNIKELLKIKGIAFLNEQDEMEFTGYGEAIPDNENPFPDYEILSKGLPSKPNLIENYFGRGKECVNWFGQDARTYEPDRKPKMAVLWTTKGCVGRCAFCQRFCKGYHFFDLNKFDRHLAELKEKHNVQFIQITDECFGISKEHTFKVAKILKKHNMLWFCFGVRSNTLTLEDLKFLKECGCTAIKFGVESGSQKILDIMEKRFKVNDIYTALKNAHKCGFYAPLNLCIGMPGATDQTIMETGQFVGKIARMQGIPPTNLDTACFYALPLPGSPLYEYGKLQGIIGNSVDEEEKFLIYISKGDCTTKEDFVNLTGMSTKQALFWIFLLSYEAMRTFCHTPTKKRLLRISKGTRNKQRDKNKSLFTFIIKELTSKRAIHSLLSPINSLNRVLCRLPLTTKIPRPLIYPLMRNLLYAEYIIQNFFACVLRIFRKKKEQNLDFQFKRKKCKPLTEEGESLRKINQKIRETLPAPKTPTEKNQQILYLGR